MRDEKNRNASPEIADRKEINETPKPFHPSSLRPHPSLKIRLDQYLVEHGHADSREKAQRMIRAGQVRQDTRVLDKPGLRVAEDAPLLVTPLHDRFVSRGGWKLEAAFDAFPLLSPSPTVCADIGSSTGGFTDCLLQHGASKVYAIDVGTHQLVDKIRDDERVVVMENTNARFLKAETLSDPIDLVVTDVSFISLKLILPAASNILRPDTGQAVALIKPQFEAGPAGVGKGGVVRDPAVHMQVLREIVLEAVPQNGFFAAGLIPSPILGPAGNREYLLWLTRTAPENPVPYTLEGAVEAAFQITTSAH
jgi:23S rRNA (cytidine1920-2'-O)/16S rRNA (cytidine1409-2'-O)-methyltransferase